VSERRTSGDWHLRYGYRIVASLTLALGVYVLLLFWETFAGFGANRSLVATRAEVAFWYGLPALQAGLDLDLLLAFLGRGIGRLLIVLNLALWAEFAFNLCIIFALAGSGALF
jgi:hypothetical protein